eukprot:scaffold9463_cov136-Skeletonema_dohrnii-CCMP3373.AAC.2
MPSLVIDKAVAAAKAEVDNAISNMNNNLPKHASSSSSPLRRHQDYSSPLFRDEVVQQEMRYFDQVLRGDKGVGGCGYNLPVYKPSFGKRVEGTKHNISIQKQRQSSSPNRSNTSSFPTSHHRRPAKQSKRHVRSRNIRQQTNRKLLHTSRRVIRKLSAMGKRFSKKWGVVATSIHHKILVAMASMNSLLENNNGGSSTRQQSRSFGQAVARSQHQSGSSTSNQNEVLTDNGDNSNNRGALPRVPQLLITGPATWFKNRTQSISAKAIAKAKDSIRNRNVSFIV